MSLYLKYRPENFENMVGHKNIINSLITLLSSDTLPHAFIFSGPSGTGKTTFARILANVLKADKNDIIEINVANTNGVDYIRELSSSAKYVPLLGQNKVFILDECQQLTKEAQNCLLKILEDSPLHSYFILCTTDSAKLITTIKNRCTSYNLTILSNKEIEEILNRVIKEEKMCISEDVFNLIVYKAEGCPRKALVLLNQVKDISDLDEACKLLADELDKENEIIDLCKLLIKRPKVSWKEVVKVFENVNIEPEQIRIIFAGYLAGALKKSDNPAFYGNKLELFLSPLTYGSQKAEILYIIYKAWNLI